MWRIGNFEIDFAGLEQWPSVVPAAAAIALLTAVLYAAERKVVGMRAGLALTGLRMLLIGVLTAALLDLRIREIQDESESLARRVVVAVDGSWSMDLPDRHMTDTQRLRAADAAGMLPPGTRTVKLEGPAVLAAVAESRLALLAEELRLLSETLREPGARLDGPHPRAVAALAEVRMLAAVAKGATTRIENLLKPDVRLPDFARGPLQSAVAAAGQSVEGGAAKDNGTLRKLALLLERAGKLPLESDVMLGRQSSGDLSGLSRDYDEFLQTAGIGELRRSLLVLGADLGSLAERVDGELLRQGGTTLAGVLNKVAEETRRGRVRDTLRQGLLGKLEATYRVRFVGFDREAVELERAGLDTRLEAPAAAPVDEAGLAEWRKKRAKPDTAKAAMDGAFTDFAPALRTSIRGLTGATVAGVVVISDGIGNSPPRRGAEREAPGLRTLAGRLGVPVVGIDAGAPPVLASGGTGDGPTDRIPKDLRIVSVDVPRSVFVKTQAEAVVHYEAGGVTDGTMLSFTLEEDGKPVPDGTKEIPAQAAGSVVFKLDTERTGTRSLNVRVKPVPGEFITTNNRRGFDYTVTDSRLRVLVMAEDPGWEWRYVKDTLERDAVRKDLPADHALNKDKRLELDFVVLTPGELYGSGSRDASNLVRPWGTIPETSADIARYDTIILLDPDPKGRFFRRQRADEPPPLLKLISDFVLRRGGTAIISPGKQYYAARRLLPPDVRERFESLLPVVLPGVDDPAYGADGGESGRPFWLEPTDEGRRDNVCRLAGEREDNGAVWRGLPPHYWRLPSNDVRPGATVLVGLRNTEPSAREDDTAAATEPPPAGADPKSGTPAGSAGDERARGRRDFERRNAVIAHHSAGLGRVMTVAVPTTWRMRLKVGDVYHGRLWGQIVRWAAPTGWLEGNEFVQFRTSKTRYAAGEPVKVTVRFTDKDGKPLPRDSITPEMVATLGGGTAAPGTGGPGATDGAVVERVRLTPVTDVEGVWTAEFRNLGEGRFRLAPSLGGAGATVPETGFVMPQRPVTVEVGDASKGGIGGDLPPDAWPELLKPVRDPSDPSDALAVMAGAGGGAVIDLVSAADVLPELLAGLEKPIDHLRRRPEESGTRWELWVLLTLFVGIVAVEWIVRKWVGLI